MSGGMPRGRITGLAFLSGRAADVQRWLDAMNLKPAKGFAAADCLCPTIQLIPRSVQGT